MNNHFNSNKSEETLPINNLMEEIKNAPYFKEIGRGLHRKTYRIGNSMICLKVPHPKQFTPTILYFMQTEFMMYQISHLWNFDVVPFTKVILQNSKEIEQITIAFNKANPNERLQYPLLIQNYVNSSNSSPLLDLDHAQKALMFNWITGRQDRAKENSIVNSKGRIFEIDNELTFSKIEDICEPHWLLNQTAIKDRPFDNNLLAGILNLPEMIILKLETLPQNHISHSHPRARQIKAARNGTVEKVQIQVIENLLMLKSIIRNLQSISAQITPKTIEDELKKIGNKNYVS